MKILFVISTACIFYSGHSSALRQSSKFRSFQPITNITKRTSLPKIYFTRSPKKPVKIGKARSRSHKIIAGLKEVHRALKKEIISPIHRRLKEVPGYSVVEMLVRKSHHFLQKVPGFKYIERKLGPFMAYQIFSTLKMSLKYTLIYGIYQYSKAAREKKHKLHFEDMSLKIEDIQTEKNETVKKTKTENLISEIREDLEKNINTYLTTNYGLLYLTFLDDHYAEEVINWEKIISMITVHTINVPLVYLLTNQIYTKYQENKPIIQQYRDTVLDLALQHPSPESATAAAAIVGRDQSIEDEPRYQNNHEFVKLLQYITTTKHPFQTDKDAQNLVRIHTLLGKLSKTLSPLLIEHKEADLPEWARP